MIPLAAAVIDRLTRAHLNEHAIARWFRYPRRELHGRTPRQAIVGDQREVLRLAERDAESIRGDLDLGGPATQRRGAWNDGHETAGVLPRELLRG